MKTVPLTQGRFALVDDEDFELVSQFKWHALKNSGGHIWYAVRTLNSNGIRRTVYMHQLVFPHLLPHTDHIDRNGLNNQKSNLRACTSVENGRNRKIQKHSSQYKGVSYFSPSKRWAAYFTPSPGMKKHLGYFHSEEEAARAYDVAAQNHYGEFARTNKQMEAS